MTTWLRTYTVDPALADEFVEFLTTEVFPARRAFGFTTGNVWVTPEKDRVIWLASADVSSEEFAELEDRWNASAERDAVFAGKPTYVTDKDLREVIEVQY